MRILTLLGSPRRNGNTAAVLRAFENAVAGTHILEHIHAADLLVHGCLGCDHCQETDSEPACLQRDDMADLLEKILAADVVVYASPVYVWDFSAQMKLLLDRHNALVKWKRFDGKSLMAGKKALLLVTCGGDAESNADLIFKVFERECRYLQCAVIGKVAVANCTVPKELGEKADAARDALLKALESSSSV